MKTATSNPAVFRKFWFSIAKLGVTICEDVWNDSDFWRHRRYHVDPVDVLAQAGLALPA